MEGKIKHFDFISGLTLYLDVCLRNDCPVLGVDLPTGQERSPKPEGAVGNDGMVTRAEHCKISTDALRICGLPTSREKEVLFVHQVLLSVSHVVRGVNKDNF